MPGKAGQELQRVADFATQRNLCKPVFTEFVFLSTISVRAN